MSDGQCTDTKTGILLHANELGLLSEGEKQQFEIHLLECEYCLAQVENLREHVVALRSDGAIQESVAVQNGEYTAAGNWLNRVRLAIWSKTNLRARPFYAVAVAVLLLLAGHLITRSLLRRDVGALQVVTLVPNRGVSIEPFVRSREEDGLLAIVIEGIAPGQGFDVIVLNGREQVISRTTSLSGNDNVVVCRLLFPAELMKPGLYSVHVIPRSDGPSVDTLRYSFRVVD